MQTQTPPPPVTQSNTTQAEAAPTEEHLQALLRAVIEALELPADTVYAHVNALTPEKIRETLGGQHYSGPLTHVIAALFATPAAAQADAFPPPPHPPHPHHPPHPVHPMHPHHRFPMPPRNVHQPMAFGGMLNSLFPGLACISGSRLASAAQDAQHGAASWGWRCAQRVAETFGMATLQTVPPLPDNVLSYASTGTAYALTFLKQRAWNVYATVWYTRCIRSTASTHECATAISPETQLRPSGKRMLHIWHVP
jgi:hypothetical protein